MSDRLRYNPKKTFQAIGVLLEQIREKNESYLRILKLLYIADRISLEKTGQTLTGDKVCAMKHGPVLSRTYNTIKGEDPCSTDWNEFFQRINYKIFLIKNPGNGELSKFEISLLNETQEKYQAINDWDLIEETHTFDEWKQHYEEGTSRLIPLEDILAAVGKSEHLDYVLEKQREDDYFDQLFGGEEDAMACRSMKQLLVFNDQFEHLLSHLAQWMEDHKSKIKKAFVTVRDAGLMFLLVQNQVRFDGEFEDILSDLDIEIAQNPEYSLIHLSVLALPNCSQEGYESFLSPTYTLEYAHV